MALNNQDSNSEEKIMAEINMTPLIDIMLVLLIIFMVTSSISLESGLDIDLPKTKTTNTAHEQSAVLVSLDRMANVSVQGQEVTMESLKVAIEAALREEKTQMVVFEGDEKAHLGKIIEIMDIAKEAGASKFAIATESPNN